MNGISGSPCSSCIQAKPAITQRIFRIPTWNVFRIIRPIFNSVYNLKRPLGSEFLFFPGGNRKRPYQLALLIKCKLIVHLVNNNKLIRAFLCTSETSSADQQAKNDKNQK